MLQVEVFKTNINESWQAERITKKLLECLPDHDVHFDLEDHEKILRVEASVIDKNSIISVLTTHGFICETLEN